MDIAVKVDPDGHASGGGCAIVVTAISFGWALSGWRAPAERADSPATGLGEQAPDLLNAK